MPNCLPKGEILLCLKRNRKVFEAIGLSFILVAWGLEWNSIKKWEDANNTLVRFENSFFVAMHSEDDRFERLYEFSISRAIQKHEISKDDINDSYKIGWKYGSVRKIWFDMSLFEIQGVTELLKNVSEISGRYDLGLPKSYYDIEQRSTSLAKELVSYVSNDPKIKGVIFVPKIDNVTIFQAAQFRKKIGSLVQDSITPLNDLMQSIQKKSKTSFRRHSILFIFGSLVLILTKMIEWWAERKSDKSD